MKTQKLLMVIDVQNDFLTGSLGACKSEADSLAFQEKISNLINEFKNNNDEIYFTADTHLEEKYSSSIEGSIVPSHCIKGSLGHKFPKLLEDLIKENNFKVIEKNYFSESFYMSEIASKFSEVHFVGICTDICVISNAVTLKSFNSELKIVVHSDLCKGTSEENHNKALDIMRILLIDVK